MEYSPQQLEVIGRVLAWHRDEAAPKRLTLGGYAGTGKTTVIKAIVARVGESLVSVAAYTGKAVFVLRSKGLTATTVHKLIYQPAERCASCSEFVAICAANNTRRKASQEPMCPQAGTKIGWARVPKLDAKLIVIDEASMLSSRLMQDVESYGIKVLYVGDHGQLEPVGSDPKLMQAPDLRLEKIHRQAEGSSIIRFAHELRRGAPPQYFRSDAQVRIHHGTPSDLARFDVVLCGFNRARVAVNARVRERRGYRGKLPNPGERVICLRNDAGRGLFNGMLATVMSMSDSGRMAVVDDAGNEYKDLQVQVDQFGRQRTLEPDRDDDETTFWDYGYCLTVHKSQGSEWPNVCVLEQLSAIWSPSRWRYTAATRASATITYCNR